MRFNSHKIDQQMDIKDSSAHPQTIRSTVTLLGGRSLVDMTGIWVHASCERNKGTNDHVSIPFQEIPAVYFEDTFIKGKRVRWKQKSSGKIKLPEGLFSTQNSCKDL